MSTDIPNGFHWRLLSLEQKLRDLEEAKPELVAERVVHLAREVHELRDDMHSLRRAFYGFALSVAASAIVFAFTVFQVWGH